jgi:hypothetical protein
LKNMRRLREFGEKDEWKAGEAEGGAGVGNVRGEQGGEIDSVVGGGR